jgi:hypothetical protein
MDPTEYEKMEHLLIEMFGKEKGEKLAKVIYDFVASEMQAHVWASSGD